MKIGMGELILVLVIIFVLFGAGKLPEVMGQIGKSIKNLKDGMKEEKKEPEKKQLPEESNE